MENLSIKHQFFSFLEKSKLVKNKIDTTLTLLYDYVIDDFKSKKACPQLDLNCMLELNEFFNVLDTYLSEFQDYITGPTECVPCDGNVKDKTGVRYDGVGLKNKLENDGLVNGKVTVNNNENNIAINEVDNVVSNDDVGNQSIVENDKPVNASYKLTKQHTAVKDIGELTSTVVCETTGFSSYECEQSNFTIKRRAQMEIGGEYKISVKHMKNLNNFHVNIMNEKTKDFLKNWDAMVKFYKTHASDEKYILESQAECGDIFVTVLYNSLWYRAKILQTNRHSMLLQLHLIDFGKCITASLKNCRLLKSEFGFPVVLQNVTLNLDFTPQRQLLFDALVGDAEEDILFQVKCLGIVEGRFHITMKETSVDVDINEIINALPASETEFNKQTPIEDASKELSIEEGLEDFDPMKEAFYSETNDYKINPDNACQAVIGYIPNDERRFCKFGKSCRKKGCPRLHEEQDPNGWTKDQEQALAKSYEMAELPLHEVIQINVSHVVDIGEFYARLEHPTSEEEETLESLLDFMNQKENIAVMKKLPTLPAPGQVVIASYKGYFQRGKVVFYDFETDACVVFFVDLGTRAWVHLNSLRQMEGKYNHLPFQAVHFSIKSHLEFDMPTRSDLYISCLHLFRSLVLYKDLFCVVQSETVEHHNVLLFTKQMNDLVEYFSTCCKRILESHKADTTSESTLDSDGSKATFRFKIDDVAFLPG